MQPTFTAGSAGAITVELENAFAMLAVSTTNQTVTLGSSSTTAAFFLSQGSTTPITSVVIPAGETSVTVYYSDTTAGMPTLMANDSALSSTASQPVTVIAAAASQLVITSGPPSSLTPGQTFTLIAKVEDPYHNLADFNGSVTLALTGDSNYPVTVTAIDGVATFSGLTVTANDAGMQMAVSATGLKSATTNDLNVTVSPTSTPTPTPTPTPSPTPTIVLEGLVTTQKTNKKGKPTGKPVFKGFYLKFSEAMNAATAGVAGDYHVFSKVVKKGKKGSTTTLKPVAFSVSYGAANDEVMIGVSSTKPFAKGGEITLSGVTSQAGVALAAADLTFTITTNAKGIVLS